MQVEQAAAGGRSQGPVAPGLPTGTLAIAAFARASTVAFLAALFLSAGLDKVLHYSKFIAALNSYVVVPGHGGRYIAAAVLLAELGVGLGVLVPVWRRLAAVVMCGMLTVFAAALAVNVYFGVTAGCGCWFTVTLGRPTYFHVALDLVLAALAASLMLGSGFRTQRHSEGKEVRFE